MRELDETEQLLQTCFNDGKVLNRFTITVGVSHCRMWHRNDKCYFLNKISQ